MPADEFCRAVARFVMTPEELPDSLNEALFAIDEMSTPRGQERLEAALTSHDPGIPLDGDLSPLDTALTVWLHAPDLLAAMHNRERMTRLTAFEHYAAGQAQPLVLHETLPGPRSLDELATALDGWFASHNRGRCTTRIEHYQIDQEIWYLIRHGDSFSRTPKVEQWKTEIIHFRPQKDDVVVHSPDFDEIRINARTRGERQMYRRLFGAYLKGDAEHFFDKRTYTLEPLRTDGRDALDSQDVEGIVRVTLREVEIAVESAFNEVFILQADDVFQYAAAANRGAIPGIGKIQRAAFDFYFEKSERPHPVQIRLPNLLKLGRHCDGRLVNELLSRRGFRVASPAKESERLD
jgi:hypothetical protein